MHMPAGTSSTACSVRSVLLLLPPHHIVDRRRVLPRDLEYLLHDHRFLLVLFLLPLLLRLQLQLLLLLHQIYSLLFATVAMLY